MEHSGFVTAVFRLPKSPAERQKFCDAISIGKSLHGAEVTAMSCEDEITRVEKLEAQLDELGEEIRA